MPTIDPLTKLENKFSEVIQRQAAKSEICRDIVRIGYEEGVGNPVYLSRKVFETCVRTSPDLGPACVDENLHTLAATLRWHRDVANGGPSPPPLPVHVLTAAFGVGCDHPSAPGSLRWKVWTASPLSADCSGAG